MAEEPFAASAEQLGEEEQLVRRYLKEARKADRCWTRYLDSEDALKEFERNLARTNVSFQTELSTAFDVEKTCSAYKRKVASKATLARLERALSLGDGSFTRQVRVYVSFSSMNGHTAHTFGMALAYGQPMSPEVSAKTNMFVQQGTTSVSQVQKCLQFYVEHVLFSGKPNPTPSCRAFYPTREDIWSHIQS
ncbi:hypothetical protein MRX96_030675 [Rhipicephalus microplus]